MTKAKTRMKMKNDKPLVLGSPHSEPTVTGETTDTCQCRGSNEPLSSEIQAKSLWQFLQELTYEHSATMVRKDPDKGKVKGEHFRKRN